MKSPHTPGDWRIGKRGGNAGVGAIYGPKGEEIAVFSGMLSPDEELANARLIVAAPELLEALNASHAWLERLVEKHGENYTGPLRALSKARRAIARATQP